MMARPRQKRPSRDDMRAIYRLARAEAKERDVNVGIRPSARRRLNWLRDEYFRCDSQTAAVNLMCLRLTGSLEPWEDEKLAINQGNTHV